MQTPIIVDQNGDVMFFGSVEEAEAYIEPIDVKNNEYVAFDSEGRLLRLIATIPRVTIEQAELNPAHAEMLRQTLIQFYENLGIPENQLRADSLQQLITRGLENKK